MIPIAQTPVLEGSIFSRSWYMALYSLARNALTMLDAKPGQAPVAITVGASPFIYTATYGGSVAISGGSVTGTTLKRNSITVWSGTGTAADGVINVRAGDIVTVTYSASMPTMYQLSD